MQIPRLITTKESRKIYGSIIAKKDGSSSKKKKKERENWETRTIWSKLVGGKSTMYS